MFESLSERLNDIFKKISGRGKLSEEDVNEALRTTNHKNGRGLGCKSELGRFAAHERNELVAYVSNNLLSRSHALYG